MIQERNKTLGRPLGQYVYEGMNSAASWTSNNFKGNVSASKKEHASSDRSRHLKNTNIKRRECVFSFNLLLHTMHSYRHIMVK